MQLPLIFTATAFLFFSLVRSDDVLTEINGCTFPDGMGAAPPPHLQLKNFKKLNNPKVRPGNGGAKGRVYDNVVKWFIGERSGAASGFKWHQSPDIPKNSKQSIEHVYEKQFIKRFLSTQIKGTATGCADMKAMFFPCGQNGIQSIFDKLPAMQFPEPNKPPNYNFGFAGLEMDINSVKGYMFNQGIDHPSYFWTKNVLKDTSTKIAAIQNFIMLFEIIKDPGFQRMYDITNNRVYQAYLDIDHQITTNKIQSSNGSLLATTWASNYKTWMNQYLEDIVAPAWTWASTTRDDLEAAVTQDTNLEPTTKQSQLQQLDDIKKHPGFSQSSFTADFDLTWQASPLNGGALHPNQPSTRLHGACPSSLSSKFPFSTGTKPSATGLSDFINLFPTSIPSYSWKTVTTSSAFSASVLTTIPTTLSPKSATSTFITSTLSIPSSTSAASSTIPVSTSDPVVVTTPPPTTTVPYSTSDFPEMLPTEIPEDPEPDFTPLPESIDSGWF